MLNWSSHDHVDDTITAVGQRGVYNVQKVGNGWSLQGVGHDNLPLMSLPAEGKPFAYLALAQRYAEDIEQHAPEALVGGE